MSFETGFNPEKPTREEIISLFKEQGKSPEAMEVYLAWFDARQREMDESGGEYARVTFNIEVMEILLDAGLKIEASEYMQDNNDIEVVLENEIGRTGEENIPNELKDLWDRFLIICDEIENS